MQEQEWYDIYDFIKIPFWQTTWFYALTTGLTVLLISFLICYSVWWIIRKQRQRRYSKPWYRAVDTIQSFERQFQLSEQTSDMFYSMLTGAMKEYLAARFSLSIHGKTDEEVIVCLQSVSLSPDIMREIRHVLQVGITAKFAKQTVLQEQMKRDRDHIITIIRKTVPEHERI